MKGQAVVITIILLFTCLFTSGDALAQKKKKKRSLPKNRAGAIKIQPVSVTPINVPKEYKNGHFLDGGDLLTFSAPDGKVTTDVELSKYIVCNRQGEIAKTFHRVVMWGGGPVMLKLNAVGSLLYIDMEKKIRKIVNIDPRDIQTISLNYYNKTLIYTLGAQNLIKEYDIYSKRSETIAKLKNGILLYLAQLTRDKIIYIRPNWKIYYSAFDHEAAVRITVPVYMVHLKKNKIVELAKISNTGILFHYNIEKREVTLIVEENGYFRFISSNYRNNHKINVTGLNKDSEMEFEGLLLEHSAMNPRGTLIAGSRFNLKKKEKSERGKFEWYKLDSKSYTPTSGDIYMLDMEGNYKQMTHTKDQIEVVVDWASKRDEILYYNHKTKKYYIMELEVRDKFIRKPINMSKEKKLTIAP